MSIDEMKIKIIRLLFWIRMKTWPLRVAFMNLSWLPFWWLRKYVPRHKLTWTPAETIKSMAKELKYLEEKNEEYLKRWGETEEALRAERMARVADKMSDQQKEWSERVMGVKFKGSETN